MKLLRQAKIGCLAAAFAVAAVSLASSAAAADGDSLRAIEAAPLSGEEKQVLGGQVRAALQAGVPAEDVDVIVTRSMERGSGAAALGRFLETSADVARQGLPARPVLDRIEQGLSKGVPPERIEGAAKSLADGLAQAKPLVDGLLQNGMSAGTGGAKDAALESVARARERSIPAAAMLALGEKVRAEGQSLDQFERAVRTWSFLAGNGVPADKAEQMVRECIDRNLSERGYARLERTVNDMVRQGRSMDDIVRAADREVREGRSAGEGRDSSGKQNRGAGGSRDAGGRTGRGR